VKNMPRILPLAGIAVAGVLAINALDGARDLPGLLSGARAFAEETAAKVTKPAKGESAKTDAATGEAKDAVAAILPPPSAAPKAICAPTAAELAKEAGLSPAELQVLQHLGERRGQLDKREDDLSTQLALMAAAEAKLDAKVKALNGLKADVQSLLTQADGREQAEVNRLVKVFEGMKPKDAAPRFVLLDDSVRLPIAAKMKERALSSMLALMPPQEAKRLTESLARRFAAAQKLALNANAATAAPSEPEEVAEEAAPKSPKAAPAKRTAAKKPTPRKAAPAAAQAEAKPAATPAAAPAAAPAAPKAG